MSIYKTSINKPISTLLIFSAIIILGLFSLRQLPIDQFPQMDPPFISIMTTYPGANSSEIETNVTKLLENSLNTVDGVKKITSTSKDNISSIFLEFEWGVDIIESINEVRSAMDYIYDALPEDCSRPMIFRFNMSMMPIMQIAITSGKSYSGLEKILEDKIVNPLNRIEGIGNISISGAPSRYVYVEIDPNKIDSYNLSLEAIGQAIATNNLNLASGNVKMGNEQYQLRVESEYIESREIEDIPVLSTPDGRQVFVRDIAVVRDTIKDLTLDERINGEPGGRLVIMKQSGANTVKVCRDVRKEIKKLSKDLPPDIELQMIYDLSENISNAISGLSTSLLYALIFVVLVVLFFLGRWRATLIIAITIPISLIVAFIFLRFNNSSLNIISLSSLTIAIGMVVDDAIVVLENITKHIDRGSRPREAAIYATNEVWVSVIATTLVILAVFIPLTTLKGMAGVMFKELGWLVSITVTTSTLVAISLTPMLSSQLLKSKNGNKKKKKKRKYTYQNTVVKFLDKVDNLYSKSLRWCLCHKRISLLVLIAFFIITLIPVFTGKIGADFMPPSDNGIISINAELQTGTRVERTIQTARNIENIITEKIPETILISTSTGSSDESSMANMFSGGSNNKLSMTVRTTKKYERDRSIFDIAEMLRTELDKFPEIIKYTVKAGQGGGGGGSNSVDIKIYGHDFNTTNRLAQEFSDKIKNVKGARDIQISRETDRAELQIVFDKEKLARNGLNSATAATYVKNRITGMRAGFLKEDGKEYNILVRLQEDFRNSITDIEEMSLMTPQGKIIKLKEVADINEYWGPPNIERERRERVVTVKVTPYNVPINVLANSIQKVVDETHVPDGILVQIGGDYERMQESFGDMIMLLILVVLLVYIVMASQFESFAKPFIIMMSLPFALSGVILALLITNTSLNLIGGLGIILLVGIVVKNGIVLVDYINLMRDRGYELYDAIALSGRSRIRPVLMTAITTILGMLPMALSKSEGSELWVPLGIVVIGGATVSTFITLYVVPIVYGVMSRHGERDKEKKYRKQYVFMDIPDEDVKYLPDPYTPKEESNSRYKSDIPDDFVCKEDK